MGEKLAVNPWIGMWMRPRETLRAILNFNSSYLLPLLYWIYGLPIVLQTAQNFSLGDHYSWGVILGVGIILAMLVGYLGVSIASVLFYWTGKWIGGQGTYKDVRAAVAWSNVPSVVGIVLWILQIATFGSQIFSISLFQTPLMGVELGVLYLAFVVQTVVTIWGFVILLKALGEAQRFSAWKALLNVFLPMIILFIGLKLLGWLYLLLSGGAH